MDTAWMLDELGHAGPEHLDPGFVAGFDRKQGHPDVGEWMAGAVTDPAAGYTAEDYATHVRTEFATYRELLDRLLESTGFEIADVAVGDRIYAAYTCIRR